MLFVVFSFQYQCSRLPAKTCLQSDLLCVEWDVNNNNNNDTQSSVACLTYMSRHALENNGIGSRLR